MQKVTNSHTIWIVVEITVLIVLMVCVMMLCKWVRVNSLVSGLAWSGCFWWPHVHVICVTIWVHAHHPQEADKMTSL